MSTVTSHRCGLRLSIFAAAFLLSASLSVTTVQAQDYAGDLAETAKSWGMQMLSLIQAATGDVQQADQTLSQITTNSGKQQPTVTVASFEKSLSFSTQPRASVSSEIGDLSRPELPLRPSAAKAVELGSLATSESTKNMYCSYRDRTADYVPTEAPAGLPSNYLAAHPRYGCVVDFTDECDSHGTRVTSRTYANGHVVIETPRPDNSASQVTGASQPSSPAPADRS